MKPKEMPAPYRYLLRHDLYVVPDGTLVQALGPAPPRTWWILRSLAEDRDDDKNLYEIYPDDSVRIAEKPDHNGAVQSWTAEDLREWDEKKQRPGERVVLGRSAGVRVLSDLVEGRWYEVPNDVVRAHQLGTGRWELRGEQRLYLVEEGKRIKEQFIPHADRGWWENSFVLLSDLGVAQEPKKKKAPSPAKRKS